MRDITKNARITFTAGSRSVTCLIDAPGVSINSESYGGFEVVNRPQNVGLVNWTGSQPMSLDIPILMDNFESMASIEADITTLEAIAGRGTGAGGGTAPPQISLSTQGGFGALIPHNFGGESLTWVISSLDWGDALRRRSSGHRVRQAATVTVMQFVDDKRLTELSVAKRQNIHSSHHTTHVIKKGETLMKISRDAYGTADRWQDIAILNHINDPRHLHTGATLKLPKS